LSIEKQAPPGATGFAHRPAPLNPLPWERAKDAPLVDPALSPQDADHANNIIGEAGLEPHEGRRRAIAFTLKNFIWHIIEDCRIDSRKRDSELWHDVLARIAAGPTEAAQVFLAESQERLPHLHAAIVRGFKLEIGFEYPDCTQLTPEEAAVAYIGELEEAAEEAKRLLAEVGRESMSGRKSENSLQLFVLMLVGLLNIDRDHRPKTGQVIDAVYTALKIAELQGNDTLDQRADLLELPTEVREQVRRKLAYFGNLDRDTVRKRVAQMSAALEESNETNATPDAIRA
jgi:hypothetical protein